MSLACSWMRLTSTRSPESAVSRFLPYLSWLSFISHLPSLLCLPSDVLESTGTAVFTGSPTSSSSPATATNNPTGSSSGGAKSGAASTGATTQGGGLPPQTSGPSASTNGIPSQTAGDTTNNNHNNIGPIVGGAVVGVLVFLGSVGGTTYYLVVLRRRRFMPPPDMIVTQHQSLFASVPIMTTSGPLTPGSDGGDSVFAKSPSPNPLADAARTPSPPPIVPVTPPAPLAPMRLYVSPQARCPTLALPLSIELLLTGSFRPDHVPPHPSPDVFVRPSGYDAGHVPQSECAYESSDPRVVIIVCRSDVLFVPNMYFADILLSCNYAPYTPCKRIEMPLIKEENMVVILHCQQAQATTSCRKHQVTVQSIWSWDDRPKSEP